MVTLSIAVLARENEDEIAECLQTLTWADELIVILDTRCSDRTAWIADEMGARVVPHAFVNFAEQREFGLSLPRTDWLFYVDSDERATPAVAREIRQVIEEGRCTGWWVPRRNFMWGNEVRHGGWYPDYQLRLLKLGQAHYDPTREVHEIVDLEGEEGFLREPLLHFNYRTLGQFVAKQRQYIGYEAEILYKKGARPKPWTYVAQPLREFYRRYIKLRGYKDGWMGLMLSALVAYYYGFRTTVELGRLCRRKAPSPA